MDRLYPVVVMLTVFILGASIGSFLNVVIYRLPAQISLLYPPSRCPHCQHRLSIHDNVPVVGWLWLRGRCRYCKAPIAARYPLVEAVTGLLFMLVAWQFDSVIPVVGYWAFVSWLLALALIDLDTMTLPNPLTQSGVVGGLLFQAIAGWSITGSVAGAATQLMVGIIGMVAGIWLFDLIIVVGSAIYGQTVMGGGDAKLAAMMGAWLGWKYMLLAGFLACVTGAVVGGGGMALGLINRRQPIPFGPFLAFGALLAAIWGEAVLSAYINTFFPSL